MTPNHDSRTLAFVFAGVLLGAAGAGFPMPVMPALIGQMTGAQAGEAARVAGWLIAGFAAMQFFCVPVLGRLGDSYGRRPILILSLFALGIDCLLMASATSIAWLFAARALSGACCATGALSAACIADITPAEKRARRFGLLSAAWGIGIFIGPALGGWLGQLDPRLPFYAAALLAFSTAACGLFLMPETLAPALRRQFNWGGLNPLAALSKLSGAGPLAPLLGTLLVFQLAYLTSHAVWPFFTTERFHWAAGQIGWSLALAGLAVAVVQGLALAPIVKRLGEEGAALFGFLVVAATFFGIALASSEWMMYALILPYALGSVAASALASMVSKASPANAQGEMQGLAASCGSLASIVTPLAMTGLFGAFSKHDGGLYFPGAPYLAGGLLALTGFFACLFILRPSQYRTGADL